jgi:hypothetical protein
MRVLLLHPNDRPESAHWSAQKWDRVIDLGIAPACTYERWSALFNCPVNDLGSQRIGPAPVREAITLGSGALRDEHGVDWWDVISTQFLQHMYRVAALQNIVARETVRSEDQIFVSRGCFDSQALEIILGHPHPLPTLSAGSGLFRKLKRRCEQSRNLTRSQIRQIIFDKYDPEHRVRSNFSTTRAQLNRPAVLLPTAYVNVTRLALEFSAILPEVQFLLVVARRSGWSKALAPNVSQVDFAAYTSRHFDEKKYGDLCSRWAVLRATLIKNPLLRVLFAAGIFNSFPGILRRWLVIRNAWLNVFESEPITSVFSCDDNNPYTGIPLLLAKHRGLQSIACHHGALDGHRMVKEPFADVLLAKGEMERDYLLKTCGISFQQVELGAPTKSGVSNFSRRESSIIFFSEDYEVSGARVEEFYRAVLPFLAKLASDNHKELIIKLHPAESCRDRKRIIGRVLCSEGCVRYRIVVGPLTTEMMKQAWFAVTVISSAALDCAFFGVPVFFCRWLENWPFRYGEQFEKFGVGKQLNSALELTKIPELLQSFEARDSRDLRSPIRPETFCKLLSRKSERLEPAAV